MIRAFIHKLFLILSNWSPDKYLFWVCIFFFFFFLSSSSEHFYYACISNWKISCIETIACFGESIELFSRLNGTNLCWKWEKFEIPWQMFARTSVVNSWSQIDCDWIEIERKREKKNKTFKHHWNWLEFAVWSFRTYEQKNLWRIFSTIFSQPERKRESRKKI